MVAASTDARRPSRSGDRYGYPAKSGVLIFGASIVAVTAALEAVPAGTAGAVAIVGLAEERIDARPQVAVEEGGQIVQALREIRLFDVTDAGPEDIGATVYAADDATLSLVNTGGTLLPAGTIHGVDADGVWVQF